MRAGAEPDRLRRLAWLLPVAFALHEAEEWNIVPWFQASFVPRTELTDLGARTLLVAFSLAALAFTALASRLPSTRAWLLAILPLYVVAGFGNALTHVYWWLHFGAYAPGVISAAGLLAPLTVYVSWRALREGVVPAWYAAALYALSFAPLVGVVRAGRTLSPEQLALHRFANRVAVWLWGAPC